MKKLLALALSIMLASVSSSDSSYVKVANRPHFNNAGISVSEKMERTVPADDHRQYLSVRNPQTGIFESYVIIDGRDNYSSIEEWEKSIRENMPAVEEALTHFVAAKHSTFAQCVMAY